MWLTAKSQCQGQRPNQSPGNTGGAWREPLPGARSKPGEGWGWGRQCLAQSFLRGSGTPVSTWQVPVTWLLEIQRERGQKGASGEGSRYWPTALNGSWGLGAIAQRDGAGPVSPCGGRSIPIRPFVLGRSTTSPIPSQPSCLGERGASPKFCS